MSVDLETTRQELSDVLELLEDSPDDEELLQLKRDLEELIALEAESDAEEDGDEDGEAAAATSSTGKSALPRGGDTEDAPRGQVKLAQSYDPSAARFLMKESVVRQQSETVSATAASPTAAKSTPKPAISSSSEFKIPDNLRLLPTDTDEEKLKKRKKVKRLKNKFKVAKGEVVSSEKVRAES